MLRFLNLVQIFVLLSFACTAQSARTNEDLLRQQIANELKGDFGRLHDSIAYFSFVVEVKFDIKNKTTKVISVNVKDSLARVFLKNDSFVRLLDFNLPRGKTVEEIYIIPVLALRLLSTEKASLSKLFIKEFDRTVYKLFDFEPGNKGFSDRKYFTQPLIVYEDKTILD